MSEITIDQGSPTGLSKGGKPFGYMDNWGYYRCTIDGKKQLVHRVIYCLYHGFNLADIPLVDHFDRNRTNNAISNLRELTKAQNNANRQPQRGVSFCKQTGKWKAGYKGKWLGRWGTEADALKEVARERAA